MPTAENGELRSHRFIAVWLGAWHWSKPYPLKSPGVTMLTFLAFFTGFFVAAATGVAASDASSAPEITERAVTASVPARTPALSRATVRVTRTGRGMRCSREGTALPRCRGQATITSPITPVTADRANYRVVIQRRTAGPRLSEGRPHRRTGWIRPRRRPWPRAPAPEHRREPTGPVAARPWPPPARVRRTSRR